MHTKQREFIDRHTRERLLPTGAIAAALFVALYAALAIWQRLTGSHLPMVFVLVLTTILAIYLTKQFWRAMLLRDLRLHERLGFEATLHPIDARAFAGTFVVIYIALLYAFVYAFVYAFTHWV